MVWTVESLKHKSDSERSSEHSGGAPGQLLAHAKIPTRRACCAFEVPSSLDTAYRPVTGRCSTSGLAMERVEIRKVTAGSSETDMICRV